MSRTFFLIASVYGFFSVAFGAFGAHALKGRLDEYSIGVFRTAVEYQFFHVFALALVAILIDRYPSELWRWTGLAFTVGVFIFSGSLYLLALTGVRTWGAITPIGGVLLLAGWAMMGLTLLRGN